MPDLLTWTILDIIPYVQYKYKMELVDIFFLLDIKFLKMNIEGTAELESYINTFKLLNNFIINFLNPDQSEKNLFKNENLDKIILKPEYLSTFKQKRLAFYAKYKPDIIDILEKISTEIE